jgi:hypothetical protein
MIRKAADNPLAVAIGVGVLVPILAILLDLAGVPMHWLEGWHIGIVVGVATILALFPTVKELRRRQH